ncbi:MAG: hypothetical protein J0L63_02855 [Anaerolineae bacterium]|nr:hypothetical protein [Anaerolineae bacterium]MBN8617815.1 hypothetical protein [Anaerolineae bacterium]
MKLRKLILSLILIGVLAAMAVPALAYERTVTLTLTEEDINASFVVTNPPRRTVSDVIVDLQLDQVVISAIFTSRGKNPIPVSATLVPTITNGRLTWSVTAASANGQPASADLLSQINASIATAWRNYIKGKASTGKVTSVEISDDNITIVRTTL